MSGKVQLLDDEALEMVNGGAYQGPYFVYVIKKGDCLSVLAQRYHTTVRTLCEMNNINNPDRLFEGQNLLIPYTVE